MSGVLVLILLILLILFLRARVPVVVLNRTLLALEQTPLQAAVVIDSWTGYVDLIEMHGWCQQEKEVRCHGVRREWIIKRRVNLPALRAESVKCKGSDGKNASQERKKSEKERKMHAKN